MDPIGKTVLTLYGLGIFVVAILLIYLIIRRINIKDREDFEKRNN